MKKLSVLLLISLLSGLVSCSSDTQNPSQNNTTPKANYGGEFLIDTVRDFGNDQSPVVRLILTCDSAGLPTFASIDTIGCDKGLDSLHLSSLRRHGLIGTVLDSSGFGGGFTNKDLQSVNYLIRLYLGSAHLGTGVLTMTLDKPTDSLYGTLKLEGGDITGKTYSFSGRLDNDPVRVGNGNTKVFHTLSCRYAKNLVNPVTFQSRADAIAAGYTPDQSKACFP
jgi:hypothetical protein